MRNSDPEAVKGPTPNQLSGPLSGPKYKCTGALMHWYCYFSDWNLSLPFLPREVPTVYSCDTLMILVPQERVVLREPRDSKETQNKCKKLSREWLRAGELEEVGGELPSFHTFIRFSHNLAAEKLSHDKNWKKNVGMWSATSGVSANWKKTQTWWHLWSAGAGSSGTGVTECLC